MGKARHFLDVCIGKVQAIHGLLPALHTGAEILVCTLGPELLGMILTRCGIVIPIHADDVLRQLLHGFRVSQNDIAPEQGLLPQFLHMAAELADPIHVHLVAAHLVRQGFPTALAQVKGLVSVDVKEPGGEEGQELVHHAVHQLQGIRVCHVQGVVTLPLAEGEGGALRLVHLRELVEAPGAQDFIQMPQGGHGREF